MITYQRPIQLPALIHQSMVASSKAPNIALLLGPPGRGKTESIPAIKKYLLSQSVVDEAGFIELKNESDLQRLRCYVDGSMIPDNDAIYLDALDDTKFADVHERNAENFSKLKKLVVIDEFYNGLNPSSVTTILDYGIPILIASQGNIHNIMDVFYDDTNPENSLSPHIVADSVNLVIECRVLTNLTFGFDAKIAIANLPILKRVSNKSLRLIDDNYFNFSLYTNYPCLDP